MMESKAILSGDFAGCTCSTYINGWSAITMGMGNLKIKLLSSILFQQSNYA